jgi:type VI secretion system secreted protein VgrG
MDIAIPTISSKINLFECAIEGKKLDVYEFSMKERLLVFADSSSSHTPITGPSKILFSQKGQLNIMEECVTDIFKTDRITSGKVQLTDYDFTRPSSPPETKAKNKEYDNLEIYDFPGRFIDEKTGNRLAKVTLGRRTSSRQTLAGSSVCRHFSVGGRFDLIKHPNTDFNGTYILTEVIHDGGNQTVVSSGDKITFS